jgi:hypothetical protein
MEHISTFAALLGKAYTVTSSAEDRASRELLCQTVKADFAFLNQTFEETVGEIVWSKYSMKGSCLILFILNFLEAAGTDNSVPSLELCHRLGHAYNCQSDYKYASHRE